MPETVGTPALWGAFLVGVIFLIALDLGAFHRKAHAVTTREALIWSIVWVALSLCFNGFVYTQFGSERALEFLGAYLIEKALSVDNLFVFIVIFRYMGVGPAIMHRVLFAGIVGALVLRGLFIGVGLELIKMFSWTLYIFGGFLLFTGVKLLFTDEDAVDPSENMTYKVARKFLPLTNRYHGTKFFIRENGKLLATPLLVVLLMIETSDVVFALDSIPAVFGVSLDPFIVFTSNVCAVLGLRAMFFLLQNVLDKFAYLKYGLGLVLAFIGAKMVVAEAIHFHVPIGISLGVVAALIGGSMAVSLVLPPPEDSDEGGPGEVPTASLIDQPGVNTLPPTLSMANGPRFDPGSHRLTLGKLGMSDLHAATPEARQARFAELKTHRGEFRGQAEIESVEEGTRVVRGRLPDPVVLDVRLTYELTLPEGVSPRPGDRIEFRGTFIDAEDHLDGGVPHLHARVSADKVTMLPV